MPVKSIIDIDVNDASFRAFQNTFAKYSAMLAKHPEAWAKVNKKIDGTIKSFDDLVVSLVAQKAQMELIAKAQEKADQLTRSTADSWRALSRTTKTVASNIVGATTALLKWVGITTALGGLLGAGGLYGIDRLASSAAAGRRGAQGLGLSYGERQAFGVTYGRVLDPKSFLSGVGQATGNLASPQAAALWALGVNPTQQADTAQVGVQALTHIYGLARQTPTNQLGLLLQTRQLGELGLTLEDLRRLKDLSPQEFNQYRQQYQQRSRQFGVGDPILKKWQDLNVQLAAAGQNIKSVFITGLVGLAQPIKDLSAAFANMVKSFLGSQGFKNVIEAIAAGLKNFAAYVSTPQFQQDVAQFANDIVVLASRIHSALQWLGIIPDKNSAKSPSATATTKLPGGISIIHGSRNPFTGTWSGTPATNENGKLIALPPINNPGNLRTPGAASGFRQFSSQQAGFAAMADQLRTDEYTHGQNTLRKIIYGNAQWPGYTTTDREAYLRNVAKWTHIGPDQPLDLKSNDQLSRVMSAFTRQEGSGSYTPQAIVTVLNNTGGNATTQVAQMGFPQ